MNNWKFQSLLLGVALLQVVVLGAVWSRLSELKSSRQSTASTQNPVQYPRNISSFKNPTSIHEDDLAAIVRDVLRRELRNAMNGAQNTGGQQVAWHNDSTAIENEKPLTYEQQLASENAVNESREIVTQAVRLGVWTKDDSRKLYDNLPDLTAEQRIQLLEQFHGAVNRQELELEDVPVL